MKIHTNWHTHSSNTHAKPETYGEFHSQAHIILATIFSKLQETQWLLFGIVSIRLITCGSCLNCNLRLFGSETEGPATTGSFFSTCAETLLVPGGLQLLQEASVSLAALTTEQQVATLCNTCAATRAHCSPLPPLTEILIFSGLRNAGDSWVRAARTHAAGPRHQPKSACAHMASAHSCSAPLARLVLFQRSSRSRCSLAYSHGSQRVSCPGSASHPPLLPRLSPLPAH